MKARAICDASTDLERRFVDQQHQLRAKVFSDRLDWDVCVREGRERDQYDDLDPSYIVDLSDAQEVAGCARLLPASGPTMLEEAFRSSWPAVLSMLTTEWSKAPASASTRHCRRAGEAETFITRR